MSTNPRLLPQGWAWTSVAELAVSDIGFAFKSTDYSSSGTRLLRGENIEPGRLRWSDTKFLPQSKVDLIRHHYVEPNDIILAMDRPVVTAGLKLARVTQEDCPCLLVQRVTRLRGQLGTTDFLYYALSSPSFVKHVLVGGQTGTQLPHISGSRISSFEFAIPPINEQSRIVESLDSYLTRLDAAAEGLKRVEANLKRYRASVLKAAVEGRLVPTEAELAKKEGRDYEPASVLLARILEERRLRWEGAELAKKKARGLTPKDNTCKYSYKEPARPDHTRLSQLPEGWLWSTVETVGDVLLGRQRAPQYLTGRYSKPYLRVANIKDNKIDFSDVEQMDFEKEHLKKYSLIKNDILVSEGQSPELVGQSAIYRGELSEICFQKTLHRFRPVSPGPTAEYSQLVFRSHVKTGLFMRLASITTNIAHLTLEKFESAPFPLPPLAEQSRIIIEADRLLSKADEIDRLASMSLRRILRLRQSILKWAFEGKLVDQDPNDEPASVLLERIRAERVSASDLPRPTRGRKKSHHERLEPHRPKAVELLHRPS